MNPSLPRITLIAGLMAAALPAAAQNVQIYGIADAGVAVTNFDGKTTTAVRENRTARWGLRGAEKLGGRPAGDLPSRERGRHGHRPHR